MLFEGNDHRVIDGSNAGLLDDSEESSRDGKDIEISVGSDEDANEGLFVGSEEGVSDGVMVWCFEGNSVGIVGAFNMLKMLFCFMGAVLKSAIVH